MRAAQEVREQGTFTYAAEAMPGAAISRLMSGAGSRKPR